jgi:ascorbate PTS system EIIA or EIIAB component
MSDRSTALGAALPADAISVREPIADREAAIRRSGELLAVGGRVDAAYTDEMLAALEEYGPYIVIAPGVALAHARPSRAVHEVAFSVLTVDPPIAFGHAENDPVRLVVGLAAPDDESHIEALRQLAELLGEDDTRNRLFDAASPHAVLELIGAADEAETEGASG